MKYLVLVLIAQVLMYSCDSGNVETNDKKPIIDECGLEYIFHTSPNGTRLGEGEKVNLFDWKTIAIKNADGLEENFILHYPMPNPIINDCIIVLDINLESKIQFFLDDSLLIEAYTMRGTHSIGLDFDGIEDGCYTLKAICNYDEKKGGLASDIVLESSGKVILDKARKYKYGN